MSTRTTKSRNKKPVEDVCDICGEPYDAYCSYYRHHPWIDGRKHEIICHICYDVPKVHVVDKESGVTFLTPFDPNRIQTVKEMMDGGWDKWQAERSVKATKAAIKKGKLHSK